MPDWLIAVILGIVEGVTEFLPISSTGHLIVVGELIGLPESLKDTFEIVIQVGAVFAVIAFYWADLFNQLRTIKNDQNIQRLWIGVAIAFVPAAGIGFFFDDTIEALLFNPVTVAIALILGGIAFLVIEWTGIAQNSNDTGELQDITLRQALIVGLFQTLALIPGTSRSGTSIIGGLFAGMNRKVATQFSFYLAIPTLGLATLYTLAKDFNQLSIANLGNILIGIVIAGVVAWWSIGWLLRYISKNNFVVFGYYRILIGIIILIVFSMR